jgi:hypothetical protein
MEEDEAQEPTGQILPRTPWIIVIAVTAILFGLLGMCMGTLGVIGAVAQSTMAEFTSELNTGLPAAQQAAHKDLMAASQWMMPFAVALGLVNVLVSAGLIVGGVLSLTVRNSMSRLILMGALAGCIVHDLLKGTLAIVNTYWLQDAMAAWSGAMTSEIPQGAPNLDAVLGASVWFGVAFSLGVILLCLGYYVSSLIILKYWSAEEDY